MANYELIGLNEAGPDLRAPTASDTGTVAGDINITGTAATGSLTVTGNLDFVGTNAYIRKSDENGSLFLTPNASNGTGADIRMFGRLHSSTPNDIVFLENGSSRLHYVASTNTWDFLSFPITTTGTLASGAATITGNSSITGTLDVSGNTIIGSTSVTPDGTLHVHKSSAGTVSPSGSGNTFIVESNAATGISLLSPSASNSSIIFGSPDDNTGAIVQWNFDAALMSFRAREVGAELVFKADNDITNLTLSGASGSELATFAGDITLSEGAVSITDTANEIALAVTSYATTATGVNFSFDTLTTGQGVSITSSSASESIRQLLYVESEASTVNASIYNVYFKNDGAGTNLYLDQNGNGRTLQIDTAATSATMISAVANSLTTGIMLAMVSNSSSTGTRSLGLLKNDNSAATGATVLTLQQDAAQRALFIDQNGNDNALEIDSEATSASSLNITAANTTGNSVYINPTSLTSGSGLYVYTNSSAFTSANGLIRATIDHGSSTGTGLIIRNDGVGIGAKIDQNGNGNALKIDSEATTADAINVSAACTTGDGLFIAANSLTTGHGLYVLSTSASTSTRNLGNFTNNSALASNTTALFVQQEADQRALYIDQNGAAPAIEVDGGGIKFTNATASGNANTLDDYEEGTFTPTLTPATSGTITVSTSFNTLSYIKVGNVVTITGLVQTSSTSSPVGPSVSLNLPFAVGSGADFSKRAGGSLYFNSKDEFNGWSGASGNSFITIFRDASTFGNGSTSQFYLSFQYLT
jgi:DNA/RNA endonuclease YhcR with UshA esterase domain